MTPYQVAFYTGLFGSIHCIGMCGPLALAIPGRPGGKWLLIWDKVLYQLGRIVSYSALGLVAGLAGRQLCLLGMQKSVTLLSGLLLILAAMARWLKVYFSRSSRPGAFLSVVNCAITYALRHKSGHFAVGMLNGFLPCGFVYIALLGAINMQMPLSASAYMMFFGLGTLPLMLVATLGAGFINAPLRKRLNRLVPYFMICLGLWFILRGLSLSIPYLSPVLETNPALCHDRDIRHFSA